MRGLPTAACPDEGLLAQFVERGLDTQVSDRIRDHLDECDTCRRGVMAWVKQTRSQHRMTARLAPALPAVELALGHFQLRHRLGSGGMGVVHAAYDTRLLREVAIKLLSTGGDARADRLLLEEARAQARIAHPAVVTVYEVGETDGLRYIAMELIRGRTLRAHLTEVRPDAATILELYARAAGGLAAAHALGVVHRDFKPDNVLVEEHPTTRTAMRVVVSDFGLAARTEGPEVSRALGTPGAGTPGYMAPEQYEGRPADIRADIFSFAVSVWESLYGALPYAGRSLGELRATYQAQLRPPARPAVARAVRAWLLRALSIDPQRRPGSIASFLETLAPARPRRRPFLLGSVATLALVAGGAGALAWSRTVTPAPVTPAPAPAAPSPPPIAPAVVRAVGAELSQDLISTAVRVARPLSTTVPLLAGERRTKRAAARPVAVVDEAPTSAPVATSTDPEAVLREQLYELDRYRSNRRLLSDDVPGLPEARERAYAAIAARDAAALATILAPWRARIDAVRIDRAFIDAKIARLRVSLYLDRAPAATQANVERYFARAIHHVERGDPQRGNYLLNQAWSHFAGHLRP